MRNFFSQLLNLHEGEENKQKTLDNVKANISFTGSNLWILACAIIVASVGLNVNSTAVIIGAMLISPLMGPIIGSGFALAIFDFELLKKSLKNLLIATIASIFVSTVYFFLSPFKDAQSELLARTSPNIYDVLIAFFGGLVGVIAITRVEKGNPIPGVAIATALMPPLCTAGYGLATGNLNFFLGAFFLYSINCVFICIATFGIVKYLKYPAVQNVDSRQQKQIRFGISAIVILMLVPSVYFAFSLYKSQRFNQLANDFINKEFVQLGNVVVHKKVSYFTHPREIEVAFLLKKYSEKEIEQFNKKLVGFGMVDTKLSILQNEFDSTYNYKNSVLDELGRDKSTIAEQDKKIEELEKRLSRYHFDTKQLLSELKVIVPSITSVSVSSSQLATNDSLTETLLVYYQSQRPLTMTEKSVVQRWFNTRLKTDNIMLTTN